MGNYFYFFDVGSGNLDEGTSSSNKLYYNPSTGKIQGKGAMTGSDSGKKTYTITLIRKSKLKK